MVFFYKLSFSKQSKWNSLSKFYPLLFHVLRKTNTLRQQFSLRGFMKSKLFSQYTKTLFLLKCTMFIIAIFRWIENMYLMTFKLHICNMVNIDCYNPHKQKLLRDFSKPKSIKRAGNQNSLRFSAVDQAAYFLVKQKHLHNCIPLSLLLRV